MCRYRLEPTRKQEQVLLRHCADARYVWNLAVEQPAWWRPGRESPPGYLEQSRQPTAARAGYPWLAEGSQTVQQQARLRRLQRKLAAARRGSNRRRKVKAQVARMKARDVDRRRDWAEKTSTDLARRFDVIRVEDLKVRDMTRSARGTGENVAAKAGLNREIQRSGRWKLVRRLEDKAPGRVEKIPAAYTSQRCSACGHVDGRPRESQADFLCTACDADVNAARNIAAGHAVKARGGDRDAGPVNREPQLALPAS